MNNPIKYFLRSGIFLFLLFGLFLSLSFISSNAFADTGYQPLAPIPGFVDSSTVGAGNLSGYLNGMFKLGIALAAGLAVVMIILGGIQYMSTDAIGKKEDGKKRITAAIVGLLVALGSYMLLNTLSPDLLKTTLTLDKDVTGGSVLISQEQMNAATLDIPASGAVPVNVTNTPQNTAPWTPPPVDPNRPDTPPANLNPSEIPKPPLQATTTPSNATCTENIGQPTADRIAQGGKTYTAPATIDYDGAPNAYAVPNMGQHGLDYLQNTTSSKTGKLVNIDRDSNGNPVINNGYYVSQTSYKLNGQYLNSTQIPFVALPSGYQGAKLGDYVLLHNNSTNKEAWAIFGDYSSGSSNVEMSPAAANLIGVGFVKQGTTSNAGSVRATVYPGSASGTSANNCH